MSIIAKYIGGLFVRKFLTITVVIALVIFILDIVELIRISTAHSNMKISDIIILAMYKNYNVLQRTYPFISLLSAISMYYYLSSTRQLIAISSFGASPIDIFKPVVISLLFILSIHIFILSPIGAIFTNYYSKIESNIMHNKVNKTYIGRDSIWLTQENVEIEMVENGRKIYGVYTLIIGAKSISEQNRLIQNVDVFAVDDRGAFNFALMLNSLCIENGDRWRAKGKSIMIDKNSDAKNIENIVIYSHISFEQIMNSIASPEMLGIWHAWDFIAQAKNIGINPSRYIIHFICLLLSPLEAIVMALFGYLVVPMCCNREQKLMVNIAICIGFSLALYIVLHSSMIILLSHGLIPQLATIIPFVIFAAIGVLGYFYKFHPNSL